MWDWSSVNESISGFCGSPFWDSNRTWNSTNPDFTPCFEKTALVWLPCIFLWLFSPLEIYFQYRSVLPPIPTNRFNLLKLVCIAIVMWTTLIDAAVNYVHLDEKPSVVDCYVSIVRLFTFVLFLKLTLANKRCGVKSSWIPLIFSFLVVVCSAPQVRTEIRSGIFAHLLDEPRYEVVNCILFFVFYLLTFALFVLNCFADNYSTPVEVSSQYKCPEFDSSVLSRLTFAWFSQFIWKGYWKTLDTDDLWTLDDDLQVAKLSQQFQSNWESARDRRNKSKARANRSRPVENRTLLDDDGNQETVCDTDKGASIVTPLLQTFAPYYLYGATFKIFHSSLTFGAPMLLNLIIDFIDDEKELLWHGILYSVALLVYCVFRTLVMNQHFHIVYRLGLKISSSLVAVIYKKALRISNGARKEFTVGEIVNLMAVDAQRFKNSLFSISLMWGAPLEFGITFYLLWKVLGSSLLVGFGIWLLMLPINYLLLLKGNKLQVEQMKRKDERVKLMTEMLSGIKVLKLYAWESGFQDQIVRIRVQETDIIRKLSFYEVGTTFLYSLAMILMSISSFATYVLSNEQHVLDARVAFVSLVLFQTLGSSLTQWTYIFSEFVPILVSLGRIRKFLNAEELDPRNVSHEARPEPVVIERGRFSWDGPDSSPTLHNVNVNVEAGKLVAVVGTVGSGKSSLLSAILGEMYVQAGHVNTTGTVAYVPQQAWIRNATLKSNITLGGNDGENAQSYSRIVEACALLPDIQILPGGDKTEIGEKGINLSGGQKQRISLARAVYSEADTYLLDDPLSAVDSHVARHIFEHVIGPNGLLKSKTRILVTHNVTYLPRVDFIIVLKDGTVSESGTYEELVQREGEFANFLATYVKDESNAIVDVGAATVQPEDESTNESKRTTQTGETANEAESDGHTLIETEETAVGNVGADIYKYYLGAMGLGLLALAISLNLLRQALGVGTNYWLTIWSSNAAAPDDPNRTSNEYFYLSVYALLGLSSAAGVVVEGVALVVGLVKAAKRIHNSLLLAVLRWPTLSFDKLPLGRIINRFSSDVDIVDNTLRNIVMEFFIAIAQVMTTVFVVTFTTPIFTFALVPMVIFYYFVQRFFIATSRQLRRMESVSKSPIYSHFEETITGAQSIRSYNLQPKFICDSENMVDVNQKSTYLGFVVNRWLSVNLETVGSFIAFFAAIFAVFARSTISAGLAGLSVSYAMRIANTLYFWVRMTAEAETNVVAIERIKKYIDMPQEAAWTLSDDRRLPADWPDRGEIVFQDFQVRYQASLEPVLRGISFSVNSGEKVGIVGRTGAGKSSLTLSLFRIIESCGGKISIDDVDIATIGLHTLRSRLTIIPQDPVLFAGTLRVNLDPSDSFADANLWSALEMVNLRTHLVNADMNLHSQVEEGGSNFSVGQRQLICLARALLRKTKVLILDEATAAVDMETDEVIQATIRKEFKDSTVLTIAHRLNTVMDYDRILVLDVGTIVEYDSPDALLRSKESVFYGMATDAGLV